MKKGYLFALAVLSPLALTGCGQEESKMSLEDAKIQAVNHVSYSDYAISGTQGDFELVTKSIVEDYTFDISYTVGELKDYKGKDDSAYHFIQVSSDGKTAKVTPPNYLDSNLDFAKTYGSYAQCYLDASFSYNGEVFKTKKYNIKINAVSSCTIKDLYTADLLKSDISVEVNAYYMGAYSNTTHWQGSFVQDGDAGLLIYGLDYAKLPSGLKVGDPIHITGVTSPYSGLQELKNCTFTILKDEETISKIAKPVTIEFNKDTNFQYYNLSALVHAVGTVSDYELDEPTAGRRKIKGKINTADGASIAVYADEKYMDAANFAKVVEKFVTDATVDVTSYLGYYSKSASFDANSVQLVNPIFAE